METHVETLSISGLIAEASPLVQMVMLTLVMASVVSWCLILLRSAGLRTASNELKEFQKQFRSGSSHEDLKSFSSAIARIYTSALEEYQQLSKSGKVPEQAVMEGSQRALRMAIAEQEEQLDKSLPFLATVGSTSPYIGLFGTVWGIMNSFIGLSDTQQATLSAVAPGIAEALIATAIGLFAAIPAVIAYNRLSARSETLLHRYFSFGDEIMASLHRRIHLGS